MKKYLYPLLVAAAASTSAPAAVDFHQHIGLQLWSLREQIKTDLPAALDLIPTYGITEVEVAGTPPVPVEEYLKLIQARGLDPVAAHFSYETLQKDLAGAIHNAKVLGLRFAFVPWIPHDDKAGLTAAEAHAAAANFNQWGEAFRAEGISFGYHPHGYEFVPFAAEGGATAFDILVKGTKPALVSFEMDVFWVFHAGQDPVKLLKQLGDRWVLMHVKDIRKGAPTGFHTGHAPDTDNVAVGDGQIDWPAVLRTAQEVGVKHYFIEDETPAPLTCIPASVKYLRGLKL